MTLAAETTTATKQALAEITRLVNFLRDCEREIKEDGQLLAAARAEMEKCEAVGLLSPEEQLSEAAARRVQPKELVSESIAALQSRLAEWEKNLRPIKEALAVESKAVANIFATKLQSLSRGRVELAARDLAARTGAKDYRTASACPLARQWNEQKHALNRLAASPGIELALYCMNGLQGVMDETAVLESLLGGALPS